MTSQQKKVHKACDGQTADKACGVHTAERGKSRTEEEWRTVFAKYPREYDGMLCFQPQDEKGFTDALEQYGFCVVKVLDEKTCDASVVAMFEELNSRATSLQTVPLDPYDPNTWDDHNWPSLDRFLTGEQAYHEQAFLNRTCQTVHSVFTAIYGTHKLWTSIDHWGVMRGTTGLQFAGEPNLIDKGEWGVAPLKLHWDVDPVVYVKQGRKRYQGIIALDDCPEEVGGFCCVPGSAKFLPTWVAEGNVAIQNKYVGAGPMHRYVQKVPLRKGEMVIWDYGQAHANFSNHSNKMRLVQFVRHMPAEKWVTKFDRNAAPVVLRDAKLPRSNINLSDTAWKLLGVRRWE